MPGRDPGREPDRLKFVGRGLCGALEGNDSSGLVGKKKGPSKALAGDGERLPGIGERPVPRNVVGEERSTVSRIWGVTSVVSHVSKPESCDWRLVEGRLMEELSRCE